MGVALNIFGASFSLRSSSRLYAAFGFADSRKNIGKELTLARHWLGLPMIFENLFGFGMVLVLANG
jgi:hypothetical protein